MLEGLGLASYARLYLLAKLDHQGVSMAYYESVFIIRPAAPPANRERVVRELTELIDRMGGKLAKHEYWGLRGLAHPIRKHVQGHYFLLQLEGPAEAVSELDRTMRLTEEVMRHQIVRIKQLDLEPSPIMQTKYEYGEDKNKFSGAARPGGSDRYGERSSERSGERSAGYDRRSTGYDSGRSGVSREGVDRDGQRTDRPGASSANRYQGPSS